MTILAAVDGDSKPDRVVTIGEDLANAYDDELVVVNVLSQDEFERRDEVHTKEQYTIEDGQNDASATARSVVKATSDRPGRIQTRGLVGEVVEELLGETERVDANYLVIGGRKRTAVGKALFGSTTQSVLLSSTVPVVAVMDGK
jgi:nucleotide-binding universal stress UspA family protein